VVVMMVVGMMMMVVMMGRTHRLCAWNREGNRGEWRPMRKQIFS
jgi:hypothetical protein